MRAAFDSFLKYLSVELTTISLHYLRHEANDPSAGLLKLNCLNIHVLDITPSIHDASVRLSLDLLYDDEATLWTNLGLVHDLFKASYFTPVLDYTVPSVPVATGKHVYWDKDKVRFSKISNGNYCHYTCVLTLKYA